MDHNSCLAWRAPTRGDKRIIWGLVGDKTHQLLFAKLREEALNFSHTNPVFKCERDTFRKECDKKEIVQISFVLFKS